MRISRKNHRQLLAGLLLCATVGGCSWASWRTDVSGKLGALTGRDRDSSSGSTSVENNDRVHNPQAKVIRFEGNEWVLGDGQCRTLPPQVFQGRLQELLVQQRWRTARSYVALHRREAHGYVLTQWGQADIEALQFVAAELDQLGNGGTTAVYQQLVERGRTEPKLAEQYRLAGQQAARAATEGRLDVAGLVEVADRSGLALLRFESRRLAAIAAISLVRTDDALTWLGEAMRLSEELRSPVMMSESSLLAVQAAMQKEHATQAAEYWRAAVTARISAMAMQSHNTASHGNAGKGMAFPGNSGGVSDAALLPELDCVFWEQADQLKPTNTVWPRELGLATAPWTQRMGIGLAADQSIGMLLWSAVAQKQLVAGQPELAVVSLKKAELEARPQQKPWLRIAQARALAAQGQAAVATTVLTEPAAHQDPQVRASALAVLGSIKLASGAPAQGAQILQKTLTEHSDLQFQGRLDAEADLANAMLIIGESGPALERLRGVQRQFLAEGRWQAALTAMENEAAILELEGQTDAAADVRRRIQEIEMI